MREKDINEFYKSLEPKIRGYVKQLRDYGFNTTGSCGHEMWIKIDLCGFTSELPRLYVFLKKTFIKGFTVLTIYQSNMGRGPTVKIQFHRSNRDEGLFNNKLLDVKV